MRLRGLALLLLGLVAACAPLPPGQSRDGRWQPSPNFDQRRPNFVILHQTTSDNVVRALATLTDPQRKVSAHYLIGRDGAVLQLVDEAARAWHAGDSRWGAMGDLNSASIGIELDNTGEEPFAEAQITTLLVLLGDPRERYWILPRTCGPRRCGTDAQGRSEPMVPCVVWRKPASASGASCRRPPRRKASMLLAARAGLRHRQSACGARRLPPPFLARDGEGDLEPAAQGMLHCLLNQRLTAAPLSGVANRAR
jgi:N-acetylmuramoyl-L-alanine amidase